jgi:hypothetical protein
VIDSSKDKEEEELNNVAFHNGDGNGKVVGWNSKSKGFKN